MDTIFLIIVLISLLSILIFGVKSVLSLIKKESFERKHNLKFTGIALIILVASFVGFGLTTEDSEEVETVIKEPAQVKATNVLESSDGSAEQKEYYLTYTRPYVEDLLKKFDGTWNEFWKGTASKMSDSQITANDAINQFTLLKTSYKFLREENMDPPVEKLSKEHKKKIELFTKNLNTAILKREEATDYAIKTLKGSYSNMDKPVELISESDNFVMDASIALVTLESDLGIDLE